MNSARRVNDNGNGTKLYRFWPIFVSIILTVLWLGGLQYAVAGNTKDLQEHRQHDRKANERITEQLRVQAEANGRIDERTKQNQDMLKEVLRELRRTR